MKDLSTIQRIGTALIVIGLLGITLILISILFNLNWIAGCIGLSILSIILGFYLID